MPTRAIRIQSRNAFNAETAALRFTEEVLSSLEKRLPQPVAAPVEPPVGEDGNPLDLPRGLDAPAPDWEELQAYIASQLRIARGRLEEASDERAQEVHDDPEARAERDEAAKEGYDHLVRTRQALRAMIGDNKALSILGVEGTTPLQPDALLRSMNVAVTRLRKAETDEVEELVPGLSPDWEELAAGLEEATERLEAALMGVKLGKRDAFGALRHRERVYLEIRDLVVGFTRILDGIYRVAGRQDLGDRIRLPLPQPTPSDEEDEPDEPSGDSVPAPPISSDPDESGGTDPEEPGSKGPKTPNGPPDVLPIVAIDR